MKKKIIAVLMCALLLAGNAYMEEASGESDLSGEFTLEDLADMGMPIIDEETLNLYMAEGKTTGHLNQKMDAEWFQRAAAAYDDPESVLADILSILYASEALNSPNAEAISLEQYQKMWEWSGYALSWEKAECPEAQTGFCWQAKFSEDIQLNLYVREEDEQLLEKIEFHILLPGMSAELPIKLSYDVSAAGQKAE